MIAFSSFLCILVTLYYCAVTWAYQSYEETCTQSQPFTADSFDFTGICNAGNGNEYFTVNGNDNWLYYSKDSGAKWIPEAFLDYDTKICAANSFGKVLLASSTSSGLLHVIDIIDPATPYAYNGPYTTTWTSLSISSGSWYVLAAGTDLVMQTYFNGTDWLSKKVFDGSWTCTAVSYSGKYQYLAGNKTEIWLSKDFGSTFSMLGLSQSCVQLVIDKSGQHVYFHDGSFLHISHDFGATFQVGSMQNTWNYISVDTSGKYVSLATKAQLYLSDDYGESFQSYIDTGLKQSYPFTTMSPGNFLVLGVTTINILKNCYYFHPTSSPTTAPITAPSKLTGGQIAGIVLSVLFAVACIAYFIRYFLRTRVASVYVRKGSAEGFLDQYGSRMYEIVSSSSPKNARSQDNVAFHI